MTHSPEVSPQDLQAVRNWFIDLQRNVNALDYAAGRTSVTEDFIAFGTYANFLEGPEDAEQRQWRNVWSKIRDFKCDIDGVRAQISQDRLMGVGIGFFDSVGVGPDGEDFPRKGRFTVVLRRATTIEPFVASHSHMSLFAGTPVQSHGER